MKKIVRPRGSVRLDAIVEEDGISFITTKRDGPASVRFKGGFVTVEEEKGEVKYKEVNTNLENDGEYPHVKSEMDEKIQKSGFRVLLVSALVIIVSLIMMFVSTMFQNAEVWINVIATIVYLMMLGLVLPKAFAILLGRIFKDKEMLSFSKYLGARNVVENAYYDLGRVPTLEEIKGYSIYSSEDKYTKSYYIAFLWLIISCLRVLDGWAYWLVTIAAILILCWLDWNNKLAFIQALVVSKPDEIHYKVALEAMEDAADGINNVEIHVFEIIPDPENFNEERCSKRECPAYDFCKEESQRMAKEKGDNDPAK